MVYPNSRTIPQKIISLLSKFQKPLVETRKSAIKGAGDGVFTVKAVPKDEILCLYPGIYVPGLPPDPLIDLELVYLGHGITPSGVDSDKNPYIINIKSSFGGYIDGLATSGHTAGANLRTFDSNPNACGHKINHSSTDKNVEVISFDWDEVWDPVLQCSQYWPIPNLTRSDGSPWYLIDGTVINYNGTRPLCGAAIQSLRIVEQGEELLLDYGLTHPLPAWARGWYS